MADGGSPRCEYPLTSCVAQWAVTALLRIGTTSGMGLGRAKTLERLERVERPPPKLRRAKPGFAAKAAGRRVQKNTIPVREHPIGVSHNQGHQEKKTDAEIRGRRRSPLASRAVVIGSGRSLRRRRGVWKRVRGLVSD